MPDEYQSTNIDERTREAAEAAAESLRQDQSEEDTQLIAKLEGWFEESKTWMETTRDRWRKNEILYANETKFHETWPSMATQMRFAVVLRAVQALKSVVSDFMPGIDVQADEEDDEHFADMMQRRVRELDRDCNDGEGLKKQQLAAVEDGGIYGVGITEAVPVLEDVPGEEGEDTPSPVNGRLVDFRFEPTDPFTWFPSPDALNFDITTCRFHIFAAPVHKDMIFRVFRISVPGEGYIDKYRAFQKVSAGADGGAQTSSEQKGAYVLFKRAYFIDDNTGQPRQVYWANGILLKKEAIPWHCEKTGKVIIPFFMIGHLKSAHCLFGKGIPELIKDQAGAINEFMSGLMDLMKKAAHPIRKILKGAYERLRSSLSTIAGQPIEVNNPAEITWDTPPQMPAVAMSYLDALLQMTEDASGYREITMGRKPPGVESGRAIRLIQESAEGPVRLMLDNDIVPYCKQLGRFIVSVIKQYDQAAQILRSDTPDGKTEYKQFDPMTRFTPDGKPAGKDDEGKTLGESNLDVQIVTGARLPAGRVATEERALELYKEGIYGIEDVVQATAERDKKRVIENFYQRQGLMQAKQRMEGLERALEEFRPLVERAIGAVAGNGNGESREPAQPAGSQWFGTLQEQQMWRLVKAFPELMQTDEWLFLPDQVKQRIVVMFVVQEPEEGPVTLDAQPVEAG